MADCKHGFTRTAKGDEALTNPDMIRDMVPDYRSSLPEMDFLTDDQIVERITIFLSCLPRHCPECTGSGPS